ncbi:MAG: glycosyltransferase family 2 protein [Bacillota bacterium]|nr:glycosyl transferase family 2 [Bacillota bacterium]REJ34099.1 MAG: glycosyl transferase family 2 [Bacillota bacterium]
MKVAAVIPAYNEAANIARVLRPVVRSPVVDEVIVVCDGCEDDTAAVARRFPVKVVELPQNVGKGGAMMAGVHSTDARIILFLDADLIGLRQAHIRDLVEPVTSGTADMTLGVFDHGRLATDLAQRLAPFLSGQRAVRREVLEDIPDLEQTGFGVEVALSRYAERHGLRVVKVPLPGLAQVMKEEKAGLWRGFRARMRMYWEILKSVR